MRRGLVEGEQGQALVFAVLFLAVAAAAILGTRDAAIRIMTDARDDRAGEAAVAAAAAAVADLAVARAALLGREMDAAETAAFVAEDGVVGAARRAAARLARLEGRAAPSDVRVVAYGLEIEVHLTIAGRRHIALLEPAP